jgi:dTMP kinase
MQGKGLFICIYGPDGAGKATQARLLEDKIRDYGCMVRKVRYPVYSQQPSGPKLDHIIHKKGKALDEVEMQKLFSQNREDFEPTLESWLGSGVCVIAENYKGTGIVWGVERGLSVEQMEEINRDNIDPDISIVLDGPRREEILDHPYGDQEEWYKVRKIYLQMADRYGWVRVGADAPILTVANRVWAVVKPVLAVR